MVTPLQYRIYEFIRQYSHDQGYAPSLAEIAQGIGISAKSVSLISRSIHALVEAGRLVMDKKGYRNIGVVEDQQFCLPLLGRIAAGAPIAAIEDKQFIHFDALLQGEDRFVLQVKGDSMIDEGIWDGDLIVCQSVARAREGDIVVALIDQQETTLKTISYQVPDRITLIPANSSLKPKAYLPQRIQVQGIYVGLVRLKK